MEEFRVGARDTSEVRIPIEESSFREIKRHWIKRWKIIEFELVDKTLADFNRTVILNGRYTSFIEEDREWQLLNGIKTKHFLVYQSK